MLALLSISLVTCDAQQSSPQSQNILEGRSLTEIYLSLAILVSGLLFAGLQTRVVTKNGTGWDRNSIRLMGITLVLTFGVVLIPVGYSMEQIAPLWTLEGVIVGYLLAGIDIR